MRGDQLQSPWTWSSRSGPAIRVDVYFNNATRTLTNTGPGSRCAVVHRDTGSPDHTLVFGAPVLPDGSPDTNAPRLPAPADGAGDNTYTVNQIRSASNKQLGFPGGWQTIEDVISTQITAEP
jgi:hypothetical protein